jgi:peptidoglycan/xylan/chitin deacetylase (PgdA/CDA1 family)
VLSQARQAIARSWRKNSYEIKGLFDGGLPRFVIAPRPRGLGASLPVFCYHTVSAGRLDSDLKFLAGNRYRTLSADELLATLRGERRPSSREVVLTFDDGPVNFFDVAFPLLQEYDARAIAFVAPGMHFDVPPAAFRHVADRPMTWAELRHIHASGLVDIESHTLESRYVPEWPQPRSLNGVNGAMEDALRAAPLPLEEDLRRAKALLESRLPGKVVRHLAFPAYDGTPEAVAAAVRCGYEACHWGIIPGQPTNSTGTSPLRISRVSYEFLRRLPGDGRVSFAGLVTYRLKVIRAAHSGAPVARS